MQKKFQNKSSARSILIVLTTVLFLVLTACGGGDEEKQGTDEYFVLEYDTSECLLLGEDLSGRLLSSQYHNGEIIQFWSVERVNETQNKGVDIYLCRANAEPQLIFENVSTEFSGQWFFDADNNYYILNTDELVKVDPKGSVFFRQKVIGGSLQDICQLADGSVYLLKWMDDGTKKLLKLDTSTGEAMPLDYVALGESYDQRITAGASGLLLLDGMGIWSVDTSNGAKTILLDLAEYEYELGTTVHDFCMKDERAVDILYSGVVESLRVVDIAGSRVIITAKSEVFFDDSLMKECITLFNRSNDTYYVVAETYEDGMDVLDFYEKTNVEIGTGGGPDIVFYNSVNEPESLLEKGAFVDLSSYMEASGINEEDYFSAAFDFWKEEDVIYAANIVARPTGNWVSEDILGENHNPRIEEFVDGLLEYQEKAIFQTAWESDQVLEYFLVGSDTLWGMINWEQSTCDFSGELFAKMLEVAKRYGWDPNQDLPYVSYPILVSFYTYETEEQMEKNGRVPIGYVFEEGCFMRNNQTGVMAINSNSDQMHKQGAWEFMAFLLSDEIQTRIGQRTYPVKKSAYEAAVQREMEEGSITVSVGADGSVTKNYKAGIADLKELNNDEAAYKALHDLTQEKAVEIATLLEASRALPSRTSSIVDIITEEAASYFNGSKSVEEVVGIIENRVQLYLDERK